MLNKEKYIKYLNFKNRILIITLMNFTTICGPYDALKQHLKTESSSEDKSNQEKEIRSMIWTLRRKSRYQNEVSELHQNKQRKRG